MFDPSVSGRWALPLRVGVAADAALVVLLLVQASVMWGGPLGAVNREVLRHAPRSRFTNAVLLHVLVLAWSLALWYGIVRGVLDALLKRHGHG